MSLSDQQKREIAQQLAEKRRTLGETGFNSYLNKIEGAIPQMQQQQQSSLEEAYAAPIETGGFLGKVSRFTGADALGRGIAAGIRNFTGAEDRQRQEIMDISRQSQDSLIEAIDQARERGDQTVVDNLTRELQRNVDESQAFGASIAGRADLGVSNRDVIGSAIRTAGTIASAGSFGAGTTTGRLSSVSAPQLTSATTVGGGIMQGIGRGAAVGATSGAIFGGVSGTATGIEENKGILGTAWEATKQATTGALVGGLAGGVIGGVGGGIQARTNRRQELQGLLSASDDVDDALAKVTSSGDDMTLDLTQTSQTTPASQASSQTSRRRAGYVLKDGKLVQDKKAQALLKQGLDDKSVSVMQSMSETDKAAAKEMIKIAKEVSDTGLATKRQQEVVGRAFMQRAKDVEALNKTAGQQIDDIARSKLSGVQVNAANATDDFFNQLERAGVDVDQLRLAEKTDDIAAAFNGSDFEGIPTVQKTIKNVLKRVDPALDGAEMDGLQLHRAKRFIDNQVTYGKSAEGLTGDAERLLKGLRTGIDDVLDIQFPEYNLANTQYKDTTGALDEMRRLIGRDYLGSKNIADLRAGEVMNRLLGSASAKPLSAVQSLENTAKTYGKTYTDSILKQITFADLLDDVYDTVPTRGFKGGVQSGLEQGAMNFMQRMRQSGLLSATIDTAADKAQAARGITQEGAQAAVEAYFGI